MGTRVATVPFTMWLPPTLSSRAPAIHDRDPGPLASRSGYLLEDHPVLGLGLVTLLALVAVWLAA
jgi:hypothetical protein